LEKKFPFSYFHISLKTFLKTNFFFEKVLLTNWKKLSD
jgi:hypothetical protein